MIGNFDDESNFPNELTLTARNVSNILRIILQVR